MCYLLTEEEIEFLLERDERLIGCIYVDEFFNGSSAMRARKAPVDPPLKYPASTMGAEAYCKKLRAETNMMRERHLSGPYPPLPGDGWNEPTT